MNVEQIVIAGIAAVPAVLAAWFGYLAKTHSKQVNDAVNNRHKDHPKLYDLVLENRADLCHVKRDVEEMKFKVARIEKNCPMCDNKDA